MTTESTTPSHTPSHAPSHPRPGGTGGYSGRPSYGSSGPRGPQSGPGGRPGGYSGGGKGRPPMRQRLCRICEERKGHIDWKAVNYLRGFITDRGKILAGRSKGLCAPCQRNLARAIKLARNMALLPTSPI